MRTPVRAQIGQLDDAWHLTSFQSSFECWQKFCCLPTDSDELYIDESSCLIQVTQTQLVSPSRRPRPHVFAAGVASRPTRQPLPATNCLLCGRHPRGRLQAGGAGVAQCACALQHEAAPLSCASRRVALSTRGFGLPPFMTRWRGPMAGRGGVRWPGQRRRRRRLGGGGDGAGAAATAQGRRRRRGGGGDDVRAAAKTCGRRRRRGDGGDDLRAVSTTCGRRDDAGGATTTRGGRRGVCCRCRLYRHHRSRHYGRRDGTPPPRWQPRWRGFGRQPLSRRPSPDTPSIPLRTRRRRVPASCCSASLARDRAGTG